MVKIFSSRSYERSAKYGSKGKVQNVQSSSSMFMFNTYVLIPWKTVCFVNPRPSMFEILTIFPFLRKTYAVIYLTLTDIAFLTDVILLFDDFKLRWSLQIKA